MLTEKEIERILEGHVFAGQMTAFKDNFPAGTPIVKGIQEAAAAIAKRLSEGVVWEGETELTFYKDVLPVLALGPFEKQGKLQKNVRYHTVVFPWEETKDGSQD